MGSGWRPSLDVMTAWNFSGGLARPEMRTFLLGACLALRNILTRPPFAAHLRVIHFASTVWRILDHGDDRLTSRTSIPIVPTPFLYFPFLPSVGRPITAGQRRLDLRARNAESLRLFVNSSRSLLSTRRCQTHRKSQTQLDIYGFPGIAQISLSSNLYRNGEAGLSC